MPHIISSWKCDYCDTFEIFFDQSNIRDNLKALETVESHENGCDENPVNKKEINEEEDIKDLPSWHNRKDIA